MTQRDNRVYVAIMRDAARDAASLAEAAPEGLATTEPRQMAAETRQMAASFYIERLAHFAGRTSQWFRDEHPEIDWQRLAAYEQDIEADPPAHEPAKTWAIVEGELPSLAAKLDALLPAEEPWCGSASPGQGARGLNPEVDGAPRSLGVPQVTVPREALAAVCERWAISRVRLYGSAVRDDFTADSDIDVLVDTPADEPLGLQFFDLQEEVAALFAGREVDVVDAGRINKYLQERILAGAVEIWPCERANSESE
ncbi:MAG: nucleotidyltransferase domain-containing protein [Actinomycetes bacterium]